MNRAIIFGRRPSLGLNDPASQSARPRGRPSPQGGRGRGYAAIFGAILCALGAAAYAQPAGFYQGKTIEIIVSAGPGDSYDTLSRMVGQ